MDFAKKMGASRLIRGIRSDVDLQKETHIARLNRRISGIDTLFMLPSDAHMMTSSTFVRHIWQFGNDLKQLEGLVPQNVIDALEKKEKP